MNLTCITATTGPEFETHEGGPGKAGGDVAELKRQLDELNKRIDS